MAINKKNTEILKKRFLEECKYIAKFKGVDYCEIEGSEIKLEHRPC